MSNALRVDASRKTAVAPFPYCETFPPNLISASAATTVANQLNAAEVPRDQVPASIGRVKVYVAATGGNIKAVVIGFDGTTYTVLGISASTAVGTLSSIQTIALASAVAPGGRRILLGEVRDGTTATLGRHAGVTEAEIVQEDSRVIAKAGAFGLAVGDTFVAGDLIAPPAWAFFLRGLA